VCSSSRPQRDRYDQIAGSRIFTAGWDCEYGGAIRACKTIWHRWIDNNVDHALQLSENDPLLDWFAAHEPQRLRRILVTPGDPTTEVLACCMMAKISAFLAADGGRLSCAEIRIEETPTNAVTFDGSPATFLPMPETIRSWWHRADMSINDLGAFTQDTSRCLVSAS
jgi:hypothetical protein